MRGATCTSPSAAMSVHGVIGTPEESIQRAMTRHRGNPKTGMPPPVFKAMNVLSRSSLRPLTYQLAPVGHPVPPMSTRLLTAPEAVNRETWNVAVPVGPFEQPQPPALPPPLPPVWAGSSHDAMSLFAAAPVSNDAIRVPSGFQTVNANPNDWNPLSCPVTIDASLKRPFCV